MNYDKDEGVNDPPCATGGHIHGHNPLQTPGQLQFVPTVYDMCEIMGSIVCPSLSQVSSPTSAVGRRPAT